MTTKRLYFLLLAVIGGMFLALLAGTYEANKLLTAHSQQLTALKAKDQALSQQQLGIKQAKKDVQTYAGLQKITQAVVPEDKNQAETVRQIVNIAAANNISLAAISFPASSLGNLPSGAAPGASSSATAPSAAAATSGNSKAGSLSQLTAVKNIPGVYNLIITVQSDTNQPVEYSKFINFLSALEHNRRTAQVSTIAITPSATNHSLLTFSLTLNEYIKP